MLARRRNAPVARPAPIGITVEQVVDLIRTNGRDVEGADGQKLVLGFDQGGFSRARFRTEQGAIWRASCEVSLFTPGEVLPCKFGPVFQDDTGKIVKWWHSPAISFENGEPMGIKLQSTAPEGAAWVRLGMMGPWSDNKKSTAAYVYTNCLLEPLNAVVGQQG